MTYTENKSRKVINIDVDHTLTADPPGTYSPDPPPDLAIIGQVKKLFFSGHIIIIWTARQWDSAPQLISWLIKHSVPFHGVMMGKGGSDLYLDDKAMGLREFMALCGELI